MTWGNPPKLEPTVPDLPELMTEDFILVSRWEAVAQGSKRYFTGKACPNGHIDELYVSNNTCVSCQRDRSRAYGRKTISGIINRQRVKIYGIGTEEYEALIKTQNNKCLCCEEVFDGKLSPHLDHNHKTGKIRGVLCHKRNTGIGLFDDNPNKLKKAIEYLRKYDGVE